MQEQIKIFQSSNKQEIEELINAYIKMQSLPLHSIIYQPIPIKSGEIMHNIIVVTKRRGF